MDNMLFERFFILTACEYGVKKYGSVMGYAKKIWPQKDEKSAAQTLYAMQKKSSKTGKPQGVPLHLAVLMVDLLYNAPSFPSFSFAISEKIRLGWSDAATVHVVDQDDVVPSAHALTKAAPSAKIYTRGSISSFGNDTGHGRYPLRL